MLGKRLGKALANVKKLAAALTHAQARTFERTGVIMLDGHELTREDLILKREFNGDASAYEASVSPCGRLMVIMDIREDDELKMQGIAREFINRVQKMRKKANLVVADKIHVYFREEMPANNVATGGGGIISKVRDGYRC